MIASCVATAYTMRYGSANTGVMLAPASSWGLESPVSVGGGSMDLVPLPSPSPSELTTGSGRVPNASSPEDVSRAMCFTG